MKSIAQNSTLFTYIMSLVIERLSTLIKVKETLNTYWANRKPNIKDRVIECCFFYVPAAEERNLTILQSVIWNWEFLLILITFE